MLGRNEDASVIIHEHRMYSRSGYDICPPLIYTHSQVVRFRICFQYVGIFDSLQGYVVYDPLSNIPWVTQKVIAFIFNISLHVAPYLDFSVASGSVRLHLKHMYPVTTAAVFSGPIDMHIL